MYPTFNIAICGGGNLAHGSIATIGHHNPNFKINLLTRRPEVWKKSITGYTKGSSWESKGDLHGNLNIVSDQAEKVVPDADVVIICSPAHTKNQILKDIKPYLKRGALIGTIFGQGAFDL
jgi:opine dehydrogenase